MSNTDIAASCPMPLHHPDQPEVTDNLWQPVPPHLAQPAHPTPPPPPHPLRPTPHPAPPPPPPPAAPPPPPPPAAPPFAILCPSHPNRHTGALLGPYPDPAAADAWPQSHADSDITRLVAPL